MYYYPLTTTLVYIVIAHLKHEKKMPNDKIGRVLKNLLIAEGIFSLTNLLEFPNYNWMAWLYYIPIALLQDIIFYLMHRLFHENRYLFNNFHALHHETNDYFDAFFAWYCSWQEQIFINLMSIFIPIILFRLPQIQLYTLMVLEIYSLQKAHSPHSGHELHHKRYEKRYGSFYFMDWLMGTNN